MDILPDSKPYRGVIVSDANEIETLSASYKIERLRPPLSTLAMNGAGSGSYLDLLVILAEHGYRIVIPEMVAKEVANTFADGKTHKEHFEQSELRYAGENCVRHFCKNASPAAEPSHRYRNIRISKASKQEAHGNACYPDYLKGFDGLKTRGQIMDHQRKFQGYLEHEGEKHCRDVIVQEIKRQWAAGECIPIFFLSADGEARNLLKERLTQEFQDQDIPPVNVVTAGGLMTALDNERAGNESALNLCGLPGQGEDHWKKIWIARRESTYKQWRKENPDADSKEQNFKIKLPPWEKIRDKKGYSDALLGNYNTTFTPFADSLRGMAAELRQHQPEALKIFQALATLPDSPFVKGEVSRY